MIQIILECLIMSVVLRWVSINIIDHVTYLYIPIERYIRAIALYSELKDDLGCLIVTVCEIPVNILKIVEYKSPLYQLKISTLLQKLCAGFQNSLDAKYIPKKMYQPYFVLSAITYELLKSTIQKHLEAFRPLRVNLTLRFCRNTFNIRSHPVRAVACLY